MKCGVRRTSESAVRRIRSAKQELALANASKDKFFSIIAHDLRTPFNGLIGMTQLFSENIESYTTTDLKKGSDALQKTSKTVYELLEKSAHSWSRLQRGAIDYFPQEISSSPCQDDDVALSVEYDHKQIAIFNEIPSAAVAHADFDMISTVFRNLLSNALKFTPPGGVICPSEREDGEQIETSITDTGIGMKPEDLDKLFRIDVKFFRVGNPAKKARA